MTLLDLFLVFFKIGLFTVGGGYAMIPVMQREIVDVWQCIQNDVFVNFIGIAESTPGPIAINMATFVGFEMHGFFGAVIATLGVVLPSFIVILIIAKLFAKFSNSKIVKRMFWGFKPVVAGLIVAAAVTLGLSAIVPTTSLKNLVFDFSGFDFWALGIFVVAMILSKIKRKGKTTHPFAILILCAVLGVVIYGVLPMLA
ncbi:MAG: chromate transporter [Clostridia bacterium]|nr:chromate transporter [Clostridia bacterium]